MGQVKEPQRFAGRFRSDGIVSLDYDYDATGNVLEEDRTGLLSTLGYTNDYDDADRLTDWIRDNSDTQTWDLSPVGNWDTTTINSIPETRTHGPAHELTAQGMNPLTYDVKGNLTSDTTGKLLAWDFDNKLRSVYTDADTLADVEYTYDAIGRRIEQTNYSGMGEGRTSTSRVYVLSGQQVIAEYARSSAANAPLYRYTHSGLYIDDKVCRWQTGGEFGTYQYYHHNRQFSTVAITDSNGDPVECYAYTPYGTVLIADETGTPIGASAHDHRYLYTGRDWDVQSGLWYFRARYMDPALGRFIGRDPLGYVDGGSTYGAYFVPYRLDPSGLACSSYTVFEMAQNPGSDPHAEIAIIEACITVDSSQCQLDCNKKCTGTADVGIHFRWIALRNDFSNEGGGGSIWRGPDGENLVWDWGPGGPPSNSVLPEPDPGPGVDPDPEDNSGTRGGSLHGSRNVALSCDGGRSQGVVHVMRSTVEQVGVYEDFKLIRRISTVFVIHYNVSLGVGGKCGEVEKDDIFVTVSNSGVGQWLNGPPYILPRPNYKYSRLY